MIRKLIFATMVTGLLAACGGSQETSTATSMPTTIEAPVAAATASVRLVNAAPSSVPVRVNSAGAPVVASPVAPGAWTAERVPVVAGSNTLTFVPGGGGDALASLTTTFTADANYTVFLLGSATASTQAEGLRGVAIADGSHAPASGMAGVRFLHGIPGADPVSFATPEGRGFAAGLGYAASSSWYDVDPSSTFVISAGGEALATITAPLTAGSNTTVVLVPQGDAIGAVYVNETPR